MRTRAERRKQKIAAAPTRAELVGAKVVIECELEVSGSIPIGAATAVIEHCREYGTGDAWLVFADGRRIKLEVD